MQAKLSRRKLARYIADQIARHGVSTELLDELAAYLIDTRRERETELVVRMIEQELADRGIVIAEVTSAHPLDETMKERIEQLLDTKTLYLREKIDSGVLGGIRIDTPGKRLDATLAHKITALRALKD